MTLRYCFLPALTSLPDVASSPVAGQSAGDVEAVVGGQYVDAVVRVERAHYACRGQCRCRAAPPDPAAMFVEAHGLVGRPECTDVVGLLDDVFECLPSSAHRARGAARPDPRQHLRRTRFATHHHDERAGVERPRRDRRSRSRATRWRGCRRERAPSRRRRSRPRRRRRAGCAPGASVERSRSAVWATWITNPSPSITVDVNVDRYWSNESRASVDFRRTCRFRIRAFV